jgi:uncharacterized membrane protein SirB2
MTKNENENNGFKLTPEAKKTILLLGAITLILTPAVIYSLNNPETAMTAGLFGLLLLIAASLKSHAEGGR